MASEAVVESWIRSGFISRNGSYFLRQALSKIFPESVDILDDDAPFESDGLIDLQRKIYKLIVPEVETIYNELFSDAPYEVGKTLANEDRLSFKDSEQQSLLYGEIEFSSFVKLMKKFKPTTGGIFYDLGSGTGKAVIIARLLFDFRNCIGIELLSLLHYQATDIKTKFINEYGPEFGEIVMHHASILNYDWSDGDFIFANSTNFDRDLMCRLSELASALKPAAIVVTFTKPLINPLFEILEEVRSKMSWGRATVYIQRRLLNDRMSCGPIFLYSFPEDKFTYSERDVTLLCKYLLHRRKEKLRLL